MEKDDQSALMEISQVFGTLSHIDCQNMLWKGSFKTVFQTGFLQCVISEIH